MRHHSHDDFCHTAGSGGGNGGSSGGDASKISLGVGLGVGLPSTLAAIWQMCRWYRRSVSRGATSERDD